MMSASDKELINSVVLSMSNIKTNLKIVFLGDYEGLFSLDPGNNEDYLLIILQLVRNLKDVLHHDVIVKSLERKKTNYYTLMLLI